jgi:hypothetical protein
MITYTMPDDRKLPQDREKAEAPRPLPAPNSPFGSAPQKPAKPEYDQRSLWPVGKGDSER